MRRLTMIGLLCGCLAALPFVMAAQDNVPVTTPEVQPPPTVEGQPTLDPAIQPPLPTAQTPGEAVATAEVQVQPPLPDGVVPIPTPMGGGEVPLAAVAPAAAPIEAQASAASDPAVPVLINARNDLELLASQQLSGERPVGWGGSIDVNDPQLALLIRLDLELLAGSIFGAETRPPGWFGPIPGTTLSIARDIRHDLELLADTVGVANVRPSGWAGDDPLLRCSRALQSLVHVLERGGIFTLTVSTGDPTFCTLAEIQASQFAEENQVIGQRGAVPVQTSLGIAPAAIGSIQITGPFAIAFLDRNANQQVGAVPVGQVITPIARSYAEFSRMTLVRGDGFEVFVDYRDTSLTDDQFTALPDVNTIGSVPACNAGWCQ